MDDFQTLFVITALLVCIACGLYILSWLWAFFVALLRGAIELGQTVRGWLDRLEDTPDMDCHVHEADRAKAHVPEPLWPATVSAGGARRLRERRGGVEPQL